MLLLFHFVELYHTAKKYKYTRCQVHKHLIFICFDIYMYIKHFRNQTACLWMCICPQRSQWGFHLKQNKVGVEQRVGCHLPLPAGSGQCFFQNCQMWFFRFKLRSFNYSLYLGFPHFPGTNVTTDIRKQDAKVRERVIYSLSKKQPWWITISWFSTSLWSELN